jgi:hypothetical protein
MAATKTKSKGIAEATDGFDEYFQSSGKRWDVPWELLRVIAYHESGITTFAHAVDSDGEPVSSALGVMQTIKATVDTYNKANGTTLHHPTLKQLKAGYDWRTASVCEEPEKSIDVGAWLLHTIVGLYAKNGIKIDWHWPSDVGLVLLAYGGGSELVPKIVGKMAQKMPREDLTVANVIAVASKAYPDEPGYNNGHGFLSDPALAKHIRRELLDCAKLGMFTSPVHDSDVMPDPKLVAANDEESSGESGFGLGAAIAAILTLLIGVTMIGEEEAGEDSRAELQRRVDALGRSFNPNVVHDDTANLWRQAREKWADSLDEDLDEEALHGWDEALTWFESQFRACGLSVGVEPLTDCIERGEEFAREHPEFFSSGAGEIVELVKQTNAKLTAAVQYLDQQSRTPGMFVNLINPGMTIPTSELFARIATLYGELKNVVGMGNTLSAYVSGTAAREDKGARLEELTADYNRSASALLNECSDLARSIKDLTIANVAKQGIKDAAADLSELVAKTANWVGETIKEAAEEAVEHFTDSINLSGVAAILGTIGVAYLASKGSRK